MFAYIWLGSGTLLFPPIFFIVTVDFLVYDFIKKINNYFIYYYNLFYY
jgi:hypothetical protein